MIALKDDSSELVFELKDLFVYLIAFLFSDTALVFPVALLLFALPYFLPILLELELEICILLGKSLDLLV